MRLSHRGSVPDRRCDASSLESTSEKPELANAPRLTTERPPAGTLSTTEGEAGDPHHGEHDGCNPQQVNSKAGAEENKHQESQQDYDHDPSPFPGARIGHTFPKQLTG
jgi:hypothetical protein